MQQRLSVLSGGFARSLSGLLRLGHLLVLVGMIPGSVYFGFAQQGLLREVYTEIPGPNVSDLTSHPSFPDDPTSTETIESGFEAPTDVMEHYGQRMHGYVVPPQTGEYTFWIASDDGSKLFLSTDAEPTNRREIAAVAGWTAPREWGKEAGQESDPIELTQDQVYYVSALMKEHEGGDNLAVRWELPDGTIQEPIPGEHLLPFGTAFEAPEIARHPRDRTAIEGEAVDFTVELANTTPADFQWHRDGAPITDATNQVLTLERVGLGDNNTEFQVVVSNEKGEATSELARLSVEPDTTEPTLVSAQNLGTDEVELRFSERVDPVTSQDVANYSLNPEVAIQEATLQPDEMTVILRTDPLELQTTYTVTVDAILDQATDPNRIADGAQAEFAAVPLTPSDIGNAETESEVNFVEGGFNIRAAGSTIGGEEDQFHFSYKERFGDFDMKVRLARLDNSHVWAQAGLMVRRSLSPEAAHASILATPSLSGVVFARRSADGDETARRGGFPVNYPDTWLRIRRADDTITGYTSYDGETWHQVGSARLNNLPDRVFFGPVVSSHDASETTTAHFRGLTDASGGPVSQQRPEFEPLGPSSRTTPLVISEIMYHPAPTSEVDQEQGQFVEIFNSRPTPIDISGFALSGSIEFQFPEGTELAGGEFLVVAKSPAALESVQGVSGALGPFNGDLPRDTGTVELRNRIDARLLGVAYRDMPPWPVAADGTGHSLVLARPSYGEASIQAWAASSFKGGSPGRMDPFQRGPLDAVVINEWLANAAPPMLDFVELYNHSDRPVDLSGAWLSDRADTIRFQIPEGTTIPAEGYVTFNENELGFALDREGERIYLVDPEDRRVIDGVRFKGQEEGTGYGRYPDGADDFHPLETPTAGSANAMLRIHDVVINELMFNPISGNTGDEFVELYNRGETEIDISGWRLADGIEMTFPDGTTIPAGGYLVVAKDKQRLLGRYEQLDDANTVGDYDLVLADSGERIALLRPASPSEPGTAWIPVDEVRYVDGGQWGNWADRGGSSLELIDPRSDNRRAYNWGDSDETSKSEWVTFEHTGVLDHGRGIADELHMLLLGDGACLLDNIEVSVEGGSNRVPNPGFESGVGNWLKQGQMINSTWMRNEGSQSGGSYLLRASGGGDNGANRVETDLTQSLQSGETATIRADARWLQGHTNVLLRLKGNYLEAVGDLSPPTHLGTPGARNSRATPNAGPALYQVKHRPVLPDADEPVTVTARAHDPDGIERLLLRYRRDSEQGFQSVTMQDDGSKGDAVADDGIFSGRIPGQPTGVMVAFHIEAIDQHANAATTRFPQGAPEEQALVHFGEAGVAGNFGHYRMWFTEENVDRWAQRQELSNHDIKGTFVYGDFRAIYNIGARFRGSPFVRPSYGNPVQGGLTAYVVEFPKDDELLGAGEINLDTLEQPNRDPTLQREKMSFWIGDRLNVPFTHQRYVYVFTNGNRRGEVFTDSQEPNSEYIESWFPEADSGQEYKIDDWFEFNDAVNREFNVDATLQNFVTTGGRKKKARYRWNWEKKPVGGLNDDYSDLFELVNAVNTSGPAYTRAVESIVDVEQWMRVFAVRHIVSDWDGYGYNRGKNMFSYLPEDGSGWKMLLWDLDFSLGGGSDGTSANLFSADDPVIRRMYSHPPFRRAYLRAMQDAVDGPLRGENFNPVLDANYEAFQENDVDAESPRPIFFWLLQRAGYIQSVLEGVASDFAITSNNGNDFQTDNNRVTLQGTAPIEAKTLAVNGIAHPVTWTEVTEWQMQVAVNSGGNPLTIQAIDNEGEPIAGMQDEVTVTFDGSTELPEGNLVITEIMYNAEGADAEFLELYNRAERTTFDLSRYVLDGVDFQFPDGTLIEPGAYLVIPRDPIVFNETYGSSIPTTEAFDGRLDNDGESLRLLAPAEDDGEPRLIDRVTYDEEPPWPVAANGQGPSLQLIDARRDNDRVGNWAVTDDQPDNREPQALLPLDATWRYEQSGTDLGTEWREVDYDDSGWPEGEALLYVEDASLPGPKNTPLDLGEPTYYFRTTFDNPLESIAGYNLALTTVIDDGAVIYLNGEEIFRIEMPAGEPDFSTFTTRTVSDASVEGPFQIPATALRPGSNTLAVEVHQTNAGSSDIVLGLKLDAVPRQVTATGPHTPGVQNSVTDNMPPFPLVWLNEIQPRNSGTARDENGQAEPWLELFNEASETIGLGDFYLTDDTEELTKSGFPESAGLDGEAYRLVWLDGEGDAPSGELHADFTVEGEDGMVVLVHDSDAGPVVVDYLRYSNIPPESSYGRYPNGQAGDRIPLSIPTPGTANSLETPEVRVFINEWMANNTATLEDPTDGQFDDWLELYNAADAPARLGGFTLTDDLQESSAFTLPSGTAVPAGGYLLIWADNDSDENSQGESIHANFALNTDGEEIGLFRPDGSAVDTITFGEQQEDVSQGRFPDGAPAPFVSMEDPTPGAANRADGSGPTPPRIDPASIIIESPGMLEFSWEAEEGAGYTIQFKEALDGGAWQDLAEITADGTSASFTDTLPDDAAQRYYRVIRNP